MTDLLGHPYAFGPETLEIFHVCTGSSLASPGFAAIFSGKTCMEKFQKTNYFSEKRDPEKTQKKPEKTKKTPPTTQLFKIDDSDKTPGENRDPD